MMSRAENRYVLPKAMFVVICYSSNRKLTQALCFQHHLHQNLPVLCNTVVQSLIRDGGKVSVEVAALPGVARCHHRTKPFSSQQALGVVLMVGILSWGM